jgi:hypothetical protein
VEPTVSSSKLLDKLVSRLGRFGLDRLGLDRLGERFEAFRDRGRASANASTDIAGRVGFAVGTGRCGTHFLAEVLQHEPDVAASHEREPLIETFHRYCKWNNLPVDDEGFLQAMDSRIRADLAGRAISFESSCHLSLSIRELDERFKAKFVLLVRHPRDVVRSHLEKGWYDGPVVQRRADLALGYQDSGHFHHFLGRIAPRGDEHEDWNKLTRVGKLAWFWTTINQAAIDQAAAIPADRWRLYRLEDFDYAAYRELADFMGFTPRVTSERFDKIRTSRPGAHKRMQKRTWTDIERAELARFVEPLATKLGYDLAARKS